MLSAGRLYACRQRVHLTKALVNMTTVPRLSGDDVLAWPTFHDVPRSLPTLIMSAGSTSNGCSIQRTYWVGFSMIGSSVTKYAVSRACLADSLLAGFIAKRPSANSIAAGDKRL